ncbi:restriction endonuclease subunit S [Aeromonas veronii]|uniref:restriction endonuclease subunit S n=1 Tax=Aeromonas veronii TaxID=654 RepID=UPI002DBCD84E|nr:restriction endonuclease subunit S [Aeromonas veronii]MEB5666489.1 restriction endonuclease subunit S [Aeromonas veronii]
MAEQMMQETAGKAIPAGYQQTEVGVIPEDWSTPTINEITNNIIDYRGRTPKKLGMEWGGGNILALSAGNVKKGFIDYRAECYFGSDELYRKWMTSGHAQKDDIVFTMEAPLGNAALIPDEKRYILSQRTVLLQIAKSKINPKFIIQYFLSDLFQKYISDCATGSTAQGIKRATFEQMFVAVPLRLEEQTAIANVLSDSDALIDALEQLIAKKQAIKSATMQQLLTGRTRLPAFALRPDGTPKGYKPSELGDIPEDWFAATIHDITDNIIDYRGRTPKKLGMEWGGGNIPALSAGNVKKGFIDYQAECYFGSDELYRKWMTSGHARRDDIVFTMEAPLGNAALIPDDQMYILSQRTVLLQIARAKYNPTFIIHYFLSDSFQRYISDSATGSTAQGIKRTTFEKMYVAVPICIEEQTAIATILSDMDNELQALTQKLEKARALKQGMMQQLLTGKIRLPLAVGA